MADTQRVRLIDLQLSNFNTLQYFGTLDLFTHFLKHRHFNCQIDGIDIA